MWQFYICKTATFLSFIHSCTLELLDVLQGPPPGQDGCVCGDASNTTPHFNKNFKTSSRPIPSPTLATTLTSALTLKSATKAQLWGQMEMISSMQNHKRVPRLHFMVAPALLFQGSVTIAKVCSNLNLMAQRVFFTRIKRKKKTQKQTRNLTFWFHQL